MHHEHKNIKDILSQWHLTTLELKIASQIQISSLQLMLNIVPSQISITSTQASLFTMFLILMIALV
jgi:hypothetical protein